MTDPSIPPTKTCTKCGTEYPATTEYWYKHNYRGGQIVLRRQCKTCADERKEKMRIAAKSKSKKQNTVDVGRRYSDILHDRKQQYALANLTEWKVRRQNRRACNLQIEGRFTIKQLFAQYKAQQGLCFWCGEKLQPGWHADHVIPLSKGGSNYISNIVCACPTCNISKHNKLPHEWDGSGGKMF